MDDAGHRCVGRVADGVGTFRRRDLEFLRRRNELPPDRTIGTGGAN